MTPIDALFRAMCEAGASDLHLSCGMPPLIRKDGRMQPLDAAAQPITPEAMTSLLGPIMHDKQRHEFHERRDADFAYEIQGLARSAGTSSWIAGGRVRCFASSRPRS